ncbi:ABC transporter ATP-binding protein [uncultured Ferrovibrio sp.]|jgi:iron(III) transport system ATP-binding protein|uniref:ABC transporter ATP-binding protein n=1 Tax=uncultured Ferrovibrio sp. TaxID=1576913 RepID=UPI0026147BAE|nr:ABC transporter ATP-binding protein [uncultured Ferrovibrio sp.]
MAEPVGQASGLDLIAVSHRYGSRRAVEQVSLSVKPGEILGLLGPSGCGKSTTLRLAAGLEDLQQGEVRIGGEVVAGRGVNIPTERRHIGMVFQDHALFPHLSVADNIAFGLSRLPQAERRARAKLWADRLGLGGHFDAYPHQLSGGEQQRVALARAMAPEPRVMLLDEPFSSLDSRLRDQIRDETVAVLKQAGTATLLVTHDPEEAMRMSDRIAIMRAGRIEQIDTPDRVYAAPATPFVARFLSETNEIPGRVEGGRVHTPFGAVAAPQLGEGSSAILMFRPEALQEQDEGGVALTVERATALGAYRRLEITGAGMRLAARLPAGPLPPLGATIRFGLNPEFCFVFPAS